MKLLKDNRPDRKPGVRASFLKVPETLTPVQREALESMKKLLKYEVSDAEAA